MRLSSQHPSDMKALIHRQEEELIRLREEIEFLKVGKKLVIWKYREAAAEIEKLRAAAVENLGQIAKLSEEITRLRAAQELLQRSVMYLCGTPLFDDVIAFLNPARRKEMSDG